MTPPFEITSSAAGLLSQRDARTLRLDAGDPEAKREELRRYFHATFDADEALYEHLVGDEVFSRRADPLRHPLIFYLGHTAVFFVNKLLIAGVIDARLDPKLESICAIGVDEMSWDDLDEAHYDWPSVDEVRAYRRRVRALVDEKIGTLPLELPIRGNSPFWVTATGIAFASASRASILSTAGTTSTGCTRRRSPPSAPPSTW